MADMDYQKFILICTTEKHTKNWQKIMSFVHGRGRDLKGLVLLTCFHSKTYDAPALADPEVNYLGTCCVSTKQGNPTDSIYRGLAELGLSGGTCHLDRSARFTVSDVSFSLLKVRRLTARP